LGDIEQEIYVKKFLPFFILSLKVLSCQSLPPVPGASNCTREKLHEVIKQGRPIDDKGAEGIPLISYYVRSRAIECVTYLIEAGANINARDNKGWTPFIYAMYAQPEMRKLLQKHGALLDARTYRGETAMTVAAEIGDIETLEMLIKTGADVNQVNIYGGTAIMHAAISGKAASIAILVRHGADPNLADEKQITPLMHAASNAHIDAVQTLLASKANVNARDSAGYSAIHAPSDTQNPRSDHLEIIERLVRAGADINQKNKRGDTALSIARKRKLEAIIQRLTKLGAK
jgi:ankyrin repeat protein